MSLTGRPGCDEARPACPDRRPGIRSASFVALLVMDFFMSMGQTTAGTVLPLYARALGAGTTLVGFVSGAFAVTAVATRPFVGPAFDSFSKKRMLVAAVALVCVAMLLYGATDNLAVVIAARLLHGVGMGCLGPLAMALVSEVLPAERLNSGIGIYALAQAAAQAIGPAFGIWFSGAMGYAVTFAATAGFMAVACVLIVTLVHERPRDSRPPYRLSLSRAFAREALIPAFMLMLFDSSYMCTTAFMAIYGGLLGVEGIGVYFTVYAVCLLATRPLFGRLADRWGAQRVLVPAAGCFALSYVIVSQATTLPGFLVAAVVAACGFGACSPLIQALAFSCVPAERNGSASNTTYLGLDLGSLIGPSLGGAVVELLCVAGMSEVRAYANMWLVMLAPIAIGLVVFLLARPRLARYQARAAQAGEGAR